MVLLLVATACTSDSASRDDGAAAPVDEGSGQAEAGAGAGVPSTSAKGAPPTSAKGGASVTKSNDKVSIPSDLVFGFDSGALTADAERLLPVALELTVSLPRARFAIEGHTDNVGVATYNLELSRRRAATVASWLEAHGVAAERMTLRGWGSERPIADNSTPEGRQMNRRVEISVLSKT